MNHHPIKTAADLMTPFAVVIASFGIAEIHAAAGLTLTCLGIIYTGRRLWLSFKRPETPTGD